MWFFVPAIVEVAWDEKAYRPASWRVWAGVLPFVAWEVFSVVYYGFPFPNSAYAKLTTGVPGVAMFRQGIFYLINSLAWDPITLFAIVSLLLVAFSRGRERPARIVAIWSCSTSSTCCGSGATT